MVAPAPIFIGGMFKSGTTLLRAMLGSHPRIFTGLETQWLHEDWPADATTKSRWLDRMATMYDAPRDDIGAVCADAATPEAALDNLMSYLSTRAGKPIWGEKTPGNAGAIPRILAYWPGARIVHITRDPRDVYASMINNDRWTGVEEFVPRYLGTVAAARSWLAAQGGSHPLYYELRYEDLVATPDDAMRKLLSFLGEPYEATAAQFEGQPEDFERVLKATGKKSATLSRLAEPLTTSRVGVWRDVVPAEKWQAILAALKRAGAGTLVDELCLDNGPPRD